MSLLAVLVAALFWLVRCCSLPPPEKLPTSEWLENFSPAVYHLMEGLFDYVEFLRPGLSASQYQELRKDRLQIFRQYLDRLIADCDRLYAVTGWFLLALEEESRPEHFSSLIRLRIWFCCSVLRVKFGYLLCRLGARPPIVRGLISCLEEMDNQRNCLASAAFS